MGEGRHCLGAGRVREQSTWVRAGDEIEVLMRAGIGTEMSVRVGLYNLKQFPLLAAKYAEQSGETQGATAATNRVIRGQLNEYIANIHTSASETSFDSALDFWQCEVQPKTHLVLPLIAQG